MRTRFGIALLAAISALAGLALASPAVAAGPPNDPGSAADHWTAERIAAATPRDLVLDGRGLAYLRGANGRLVAYGHATPARAEDALRVSSARPTAKPSNPPGGGGGGGGGESDTTKPVVSDRSPAQNTSFETTQTFSAVVTDDVALKNVSIGIKIGTTTTNYAATADGDTWSVTLSFGGAGTAEWNVVAKDTAKKGGNTTTTDFWTFNVTQPGGGGGGGGGDFTDAPYETDDAVKASSGRIYFEMPSNKRLSRWAGYVCSGTALADGGTTNDRTVIVTAAHCVYDDVYKAFARNVLFIPDKDFSGVPTTSTVCATERYGCWEPDFGVVDVDWTTRTFPDNIPWDYAYYVASDASRVGKSDLDNELDVVVGGVGISFDAPTAGLQTFGIGYSYDEDPDLRYCKEPLDMEEHPDNWWLPSCDLSGGSSGGPWMQSVDDVLDGELIMSVNSWGYTTAPGMAGPKLSGTTAQCLHGRASSEPFLPSAADGDAGYAVNSTSC